MDWYTEMKKSEEVAIWLSIGYGLFERFRFWVVFCYCVDTLADAHERTDDQQCMERINTLQGDYLENKSRKRNL
jgi:hypothetical protein